MYQDYIKILESDEYYKVKKDINSLINNDSFLKEIVKVRNPLAFDRFIKMSEYKMDTSELQEERNKFIKKTLLSLNKDDIYKFFNLENLDLSRQDVIANRYLIEYIISYYFGDNYYNFMVNLNQMVNYLDSVNKNLIDKENIKIYKEFVNLRYMSMEDKINFFKLLLDLNLMEMFYDDINKAREDSHKELVNKTIKLEKDNELYNKDISSRFNVDVYCLDGEEFYGFVRCLGLKTNTDEKKTDYVFSKKKRVGYSFSYISHKNIGTIDYDRKNVTLFYDDIDYRNIMYVHHADMHAKKMQEQDGYLSEKENEILTPDALIAKTKSYNELFIKSDENGIKPKALVCYDSISGNDLSFAKRYGLAILLINTQKYKRYESYDDEYDSYTYVI